MTPAARFGRSIVRFYRAIPRLRPPVCRFEPTCSGYAEQALTDHGLVRGGSLAIRRVCRCHPWGGHGWDPVPEPREPRSNAPLREVVRPDV